MSATIRYAKAMFELAEAAKQTAAIAQAASVLQAALADETVSQALANPRLNPAQRSALAVNIAKSIKAPKVMESTVKSMVAQNRLGLLAPMLKEFQKQADAASGTTRVQVQSAQALTEEQRNQIAALVKGSLKSKSVVIEETLQPELIGGFRAFFGGRVWDVSLSGQLSRLKGQFTQRLNQPK